MTCIAEGIETERQRTYLAERGVLGQGYLLGRPDDAAAIGRLIIRQSARTEPLDGGTTLVIREPYGPARRSLACRSTREEARSMLLHAVIVPPPDVLVAVSHLVLSIDSVRARCLRPQPASRFLRRRVVAPAAPAPITADRELDLVPTER